MDAIKFVPLDPTNPYIKQYGDTVVYYNVARCIQAKTEKEMYDSKNISSVTKIMKYTLKEIKDLYPFAFESQIKPQLLAHIKHESEIDRIWAY